MGYKEPVINFNLKTGYNYYMAYSKGDFAKELGISKKELENRAKAAGFSTTEAYYNFMGGASWPIVQEITQQIIDLDRQYDELGSVGLTEEEKNNFLEKAIEQVQPYYDRKVQEIEAGIQEGNIRTAEDVLLFTRDVQNQVTETLSNLDLRQAETEEEFLNRLADITSSKSEDTQAKREEWRFRLENTRLDQIQRGIFSSGIGRKKREEQQALGQMELQTIADRYGREQLQTETARKYDIDQIRLARESAERERQARIGAPATQQALDTLGLSDISQLGPKTAIEQARLAPQRNVDIYKPGSLLDLEEERRKAVVSRKLDSQAEELALRDEERNIQRQKILADKAAAQSRLSAYGR